MATVQTSDAVYSDDTAAKKVRAFMARHMKDDWAAGDESGYTYTGMGSAAAVDLENLLQYFQRRGEAFGYQQLQYDLRELLGVGESVKK